jgi:hypothetical protein
MKFTNLKVGRRKTNTKRTLMRIKVMEMIWSVCRRNY